MLKIKVEIYASIYQYEDGAKPILEYVMNHDDAAQRRVLGEQVRSAFEAGQAVFTFPIGAGVDVHV